MKHTGITDESKTDPLIHVVDAMMVGASNAILAQESRGQDQLVNSAMLPTECPPTLELALEERGVVFGSANKRDPMFREATLPQGWQKRATDHSMWSELVDDSGVVVAMMFYKAASYDRRAFMSPK